MAELADAPSLPSWAAHARRLTKLAWTAFKVFFVLGWIVRGIAALAGTNGTGLRDALSEFPDGLLLWPLVVGFFGSLTVIVLAGFVWLVGSAAAGYSEPRTN